MRAVVAVAGQPNCGKTSLFNQLTGARAKVANYPGITVERKEARMALADGREAVLLDIPGAYSLSARTREEQIAITAIAGLNPYSEPDAVIVVVDATQLARSLYLVLQVLELRLKVVIALNMSDVVRKSRMVIDAAALERELGVPVVSVSALKGEGLEELRSTVSRVLANPTVAVGNPLALPADGPLGQDLDAVAPYIPRGWGRGDAARRRSLAAWALLSVDHDDELWQVPKELREAVARRCDLAEKQGRDTDLGLVGARYTWIDERMPLFVARTSSTLRRVTDAVDRVLIHPLAGLLIFFVVLGLLFESLFTWSEPLIEAVNNSLDIVALAVRHVVPDGILQSFLADGIIAGVGAVLAFLPQILLLFLFIGLMEDSGYMARAAFLMDRIMKSIGLTGRAFVPMLSGFACAIPAILATRTMERQRDRLLTMMVVPIMTCSARLPIYTLIIGALFPSPHEPGGRVAGFLSLQALLMVAMYVFSTVMALLAAAILGRTLFRGSAPHLLLELPPYRLPLPRSVLRMMWDRSRVFLSEAGTVILVCTVVLWALLTFPRNAELSQDYAAERSAVTAAAPGLVEGESAALLADLRRQEAGERLRSSYGGRLGRMLEPAIAPLGFDWKIGVGLIGSFAAREVFVSTMAVVYGIGEDADEASRPLRSKIQAETWPDGRRVYTPLVGLTLMVFFALAAQCMSTLAVVRRETATWRWPAFLFAYMTSSAWLFAFVVYQGGTLLGF